MPRAAQSNQSATSSPISKPVFAPGLKTIAEVQSQVFVKPISETYSDSGAPRLHYEAYSQDSEGNGVVQINLAGSQLTPLMRPAFVPDLSSYTSVLIEGAPHEAGLILLSFTQAGASGQASLIVTLAPFSTLAEISQGDHNGILQILPPTNNIVSTTMTLRANALGDYEYTTQSSTVAFNNLSPGEVAHLTQRLEGQTSDLVAAIAPQLIFSEGAPLTVGEGLQVTELTKKWIVGGLQIVGALSTLAGGVLAAQGLSDDDDVFKYWGIGLSTLGGLCRGAAGLVGPFLQTEEP